MTVPILRDIALHRPQTPADVARGRPYEVVCWTGRRGQAATVTVDHRELLANGALGGLVSGPATATPGATGRYTYSIPTVEPGRYYRLTVRAADPAVPADATSQTFQFTATPA